MDEEQKEFHRNLPSDEGRRKDPDRREESGQQPGAQTYSSSDTDGNNQNLTKTAGEGFREEPFGQNADPTFEEIDRRDGKQSK